MKQITKLSSRQSIKITMIRVWCVFSMTYKKKHLIVHEQVSVVLCRVNNRFTSDYITYVITS